MGTCNNKSREPVESMVLKYTWPRLFSGLLCHETEEKDPVIESRMHDITLQRGDGQTFFVSYKASKGPVKITLNHDRKGGTKPEFVEKSDLICEDTFEFRIKKAYSYHNGTYTVEVLDQGLQERYSANPVMVSWKVTVTK